MQGLIPASLPLCHMTFWVVMINLALSDLCQVFDKLTGQVLSDMEQLLRKSPCVF